MARIYGIEKSLAENGFDDKTIKEIIGNGNLIDIITGQGLSTLSYFISYFSLAIASCD